MKPVYAFFYYPFILLLLILLFYFYTSKSSQLLQLSPEMLCACVVYPHEGTLSVIHKHLTDEDKF